MIKLTTHSFCETKEHCVPFMHASVSLANCVKQSVSRARFVSRVLRSLTMIRAINSSLRVPELPEELLIGWIIIEVVDSRCRAPYAYACYKLCDSELWTKLKSSSFEFRLVFFNFPFRRLSPIDYRRFAACFAYKAQRSTPACVFSMFTVTAASICAMAFEKSCRKLERSFKHTISVIRDTFGKRYSFPKWLRSWYIVEERVYG